MREALNDPAIPLLDIYPEETRIEKDTWALMFIAALVTVSRTWIIKKLKEISSFPIVQ